MECQCRKCQKACMQRVGWFMPNQLDVAAKLMRMNVQELFDEHLGVDFWCPHRNEEPIFVICPSMAHITPGETFPIDPIGKCVFFQNNLCSIHKAKPYECSAFDHMTTRDVLEAEHHKVALAWKKEQQLVTNLLGRKPMLPEWSIGDLLNLCF